MNIKTTLARLENSLGENESRPPLLLSGQPAHLNPASDEVSDSFNIVLGYSNSTQSQAALDLTLLIAYQTRLATRKRVIVQAVYVVEGIHPISATVRAHSAHRDVAKMSVVQGTRSRSGSSTQLYSRRQTVNCVDARAAQIQCFEEADQVLWQARSFAMEWRGSLNTHLRFGSPAIELSKVAQQEQASLLIVGCDSPEHPLIAQLKQYCECPVMGISKRN
jgi:hypothetical protein